MRIALVCGRLMAGEDGVGDYTRRLGIELARQGHDIALISVADSTETAVRKGTKSEPDELRFRASRSGRWPREATRALQRFEPDVSVLQYVPNSFSTKGLPLNFVSSIPRQGVGAWSVVLHEICVERGPSRKRRVLHDLQRGLLRTLAWRLRPKNLYVTLESNRIRVDHLRMRSKILPLFGNIPIVPGATHREYDSRRVLFFGSLPEPDVRPGIVAAILASWTADPRLSVSVVGGPRKDREDLVATLNLSAGTPIATDHGRLRADEVSRLMSLSHVGVARNPGFCMGKSGSTVAMLEHGLVAWAPAWAADDLDLQFRTDRVVHSLSEALHMERIESREQLSDVARALLQDLERGQAQTAKAD